MSQRGTYIPPEKQKPRRWLTPRFSLRTLFVVVTTATVGAGVWWRWPVTKVTTKESEGGYTLQETYTYHRGFRSELIKHGVHRQTVNGEVELEEHYREGVLHGPYRQSEPGAIDRITGEYLAGKKHGVWNYSPRSFPMIVKGGYIENPLSIAWPSKTYRAQEHWSRGRREGLFQWWDEAENPCFRYTFKDDRLIVPAGNHSSLILRRIADGQLTDTRIQQALVQRCELVYYYLPLHTVLDRLAEKHGLRFAFRSRRIAVPPTLLSENARSYHLGQRHDDSDYAQRWLKAVPSLQSKLLLCDAPIRVDMRNGPLHAEIEAILSPLGLALDYRNGILCIVDAGSPYDWEAATGTPQLHPPAGSPLALKLNESAKPFMACTLRRALGNMSDVQGIPVKITFSHADLAAREFLDAWFDLSAASHLATDKQAVEANVLNQPSESESLTLRQVLSLLLDQANLHCHEEGGVLIIESPPR